MKAFQVAPFNIWAENQQEVDEMRQAFINFINEHGRQGRYVSAAKVTQALTHWKDNAIVRNKVIEHFHK